MPFFEPEKNRKAIPAAAEGLLGLVRSNTTFKIDEKEFFVTQWVPETKEPKALAFLSHGFCEYINDGYDEAAQNLASRGILVFAHDHTGHGRSSGERANIQTSFEADYVGPIITHCLERKRENPGLPLIICGHSLGGFMTLLTGLINPNLMDLCVLVAPFVEPIPEMATPLNVFLAKWLSPILPSFQPPGSELHVEHITRNEEWRKRIKEDPLVWQGGVKLRHGYQGLVGVQKLSKHMSEFKVPVLIQQGKEDKICLPEFAQKLYDNIGSKDKTLKWYDEAYHNLFIELEDVTKAVKEDQLNWILERLQK